MTTHRPLVPTLGLALALAACARPGASAPGAASLPGSAADKADGGDGEPVPWAKATAKTREAGGFLGARLRRDQHLLLELGPDDLGRDLGLAVHLSRGPGDFNLQRATTWSETQLLRFERRGDRVLALAPSAFYRRPPSEAPVVAPADAGESVLAILPVVSEKTPGDARSAILVDATALLVSDHTGVTWALREYFKPGEEPEFDAERSLVEAARGFPRNLEIDVRVTYTGNKAPAEPTGDAIGDIRSIPVTVRYSFFALPERPMTPRRLDDRIGYFTTLRYDFEGEPTKRPIDQWIARRRLEKRDHGAAVSPPVAPIVYYLDPGIPARWRPYVKEGVLAWNAAFAEAGFQDAVRVEDFPTEPGFSPEDLRYSTIVWVKSHDMGYAIGPSQTDPRTGEILDSDILLWSEMVRFWYVQPGQLWLSTGPRAAACAAGAARAADLALGGVLLASAGLAEVPEAFIGDGVRDIVMHEVGHTLGLRHNFGAAAGVPYDKLHDPAYTRAHGLSHSVMDYVPLNLAAPGQTQGDYFNHGVGDYDRWAIQYGYAPIYEQPADGALALTGAAPLTGDAEAAGLDKIARRSTEPSLRFLTDEDLRGDYMDPSAYIYDLSDQGLRWLEDREQLIDRAVAALPKLAEARGWDGLRMGFLALVSLRQRTLTTVASWVGGVRQHRHKPGQTGASPPMVPVPVAEQRAAVAHLIRFGFDAGAWRLDPELMNRLRPRRDGSLWGAYVFASSDMPVHRLVLAVQSAALDALLDSQRLGRLVDQAVLAPRGTSYTIAELFTTLTDAIWREVLGKAQEIDPLRRNLQRAYLDRLVRLAVPGEQPAVAFPWEDTLWWRVTARAKIVPEDARSQARWELERLAKALDKAIAGAKGLSIETRAHLAESKARVARALDATITATK